MSEISAARPATSGRTSYEVHRRTASGWEYRTARGEMDAAIREAKLALELPGTEAVRVVRDHYDPTTNCVRPNTVFRAAAAAPEAVKPSFWSRLKAPRAAARPAAAKRPNLAASLALSLVVVGLGTAITLLRS